MSNNVHNYSLELQILDNKHCLFDVHILKHKVFDKSKLSPETTTYPF